MTYHFYIFFNQTWHGLTNYEKIILLQKKGGTVAYILNIVTLCLYLNYLMYMCFPNVTFYCHVHCNLIFIVNCYIISTLLVFIIDFVIYNRHWD